MRPSDVGYTLGMPFQRLDKLAIIDVPDLDDLVGGFRT